MRRFSRAGAAMVALATLGTLVFAGSSAGHGTPWHAAKGPTKKFHHGDAGAERTQEGDPVRLRRHAARPDGALRGQGDHAHLQGHVEAGRGRRQRVAPGFPAEHGRGVAYARDGDVAGRARLDEQHVPPHRRRVQQHHQLRDAGHPPGGHTAPVGGAGREDGRRRRVGRRPWARARASGARDRLPHLHRRARDRPQLRPSRTAGAGEQLRRAVPAPGARRRCRLDQRPGLVQPRQAGDLHPQQRPNPGQRRLGRLHLRLDERRHDQLQPRRDREQRGRQGREQGGRQPRTRRLGRRKAHARIRRARREDGRLLHEADRPQQRRVALPHLLHVRPACERDLQRARCGRIGRLRREARSRLPDLDRGRLRAARGADRGRGHLRPAGLEVGRRALGLPRVHLRPAGREGGPALPRKPGDGRVPAPVRRAARPEGHRRAEQPVLRQCRRHGRQGRTPGRA